jgi:hypothetical protein
MKDIYQNINTPLTVEISKAATMLGISIITIRNRINYGYLQVSNEKYKCFAHVGSEKFTNRYRKRHFHQTKLG